MTRAVVGWCGLASRARRNWFPEFPGRGSEIQRGCRVGQQGNKETVTDFCTGSPWRVMDTISRCCCMASCVQVRGDESIHGHNCPGWFGGEAYRWNRPNRVSLNKPGLASLQGRRSGTPSPIGRLGEAAGRYSLTDENCLAAATCFSAVSSFPFASEKKGHTTLPTRPDALGSRRLAEETAAGEVCVLRSIGKPEQFQLSMAPGAAKRAAPYANTADAIHHHDAS